MRMVFSHNSTPDFLLSIMGQGALTLTLTLPQRQAVFLCLGKAAGEGKIVWKRAAPSFKHQLPVPAIVNEDNIINISSLGRGVRGERLLLCCSSWFYRSFEKLGIIERRFHSSESWLGHFYFATLGHYYVALTELTRGVDRNPFLD